MKAGRAGVDFALAVICVLQMLYQHVPALVHQICGVAFGVLIVVHALQHRRTIAALGRGRWTAERIVSTIATVALAVCIVCMVGSGLAMSTWASAAGLGGAAVARAVHLPLVYLGFCLCGLHFGLKAHRILPLDRLAGGARVAAIVVDIAVAALGVWSFAEVGFANYIFGRVGFVFFDATKPIIVSLVQHACVFALFGVIGHLIHIALRPHRKDAK